MRDPDPIGKDTHSCSAEQGNQVKDLDTFQTKAHSRRFDSVAVSMEHILFLRKQVTGCCNGSTGKAKDVRWHGKVLGHVSQKTYRERNLTIYG